MRRQLEYADNTIHEIAELGFCTESESGTGPAFSDEEIIEKAFKHFRSMEFPYPKLPLHICMQEINRLANTENSKLLKTATAYQVADTYHPHRYHAKATGRNSVFDAFHKDKALCRALRLDLKYRFYLGTHMPNSMKFTGGAQSVSNFRPGFALMLYREFCKPGAVVLDTCTGYGGRLVGFIASGFAGTYIGIDPDQQTHEGNLHLVADLSFSDKVELYNLPAEDMPHNIVRDRCDFAFTSPPYFCKERYGDNGIQADNPTQSWARYPDADGWKNGFLLPMMQLQYAALKPDTCAVVNIADVKINNTYYPLAMWCKQAGEASGFELIEYRTFPLVRRFGAHMADEVAVEPVLVFKKNSE